MTRNKFSLVPIRRTDVFQEVISRIESLVVRSRPGDKLPPERELAEALGVSRTSVRQALKVLEASHLVECHIGSGTYVSNPTVRELAGLSALLPEVVDTAFLKQLVTARCHIVRAVFKECCDKIDAKGIETLRTLLDENAQDFIERDHDEGGLDLGFESKVAELTNNAILFHMQEEIHQLWILAWNKYGKEPENKIVLHKEHLAMLEALDRRDCQLLLTLVTQHVDRDFD